MAIVTREQAFAAGVYELVRNALDKDPVYRKAYGSMAHKLPILIRTAGLAQALAFVAARPDKPQYEPQKELLNDLAIVLLHERAEDLCTASRSIAIGEYMRLTQDALQALLWFKRYAQSVLGVEPGDGEDDR